MSSSDDDDFETDFDAPRISRSKNFGAPSPSGGGASAAAAAAAAVRRLSTSGPQPPPRAASAAAAGAGLAGAGSAEVPGRAGSGAGFGDSDDDFEGAPPIRNSAPAMSALMRSTNIAHGWRFQEITKDGGVAIDCDNLGELQDEMQQTQTAVDADDLGAFGQVRSSLPSPGGRSDGKPMKSLNIVLLVVGTRGDVQPFVGIGLKLKEAGHRVRLASHEVYRKFVLDMGLEFYPLGGDPKKLSEFVVKHRGIMPGLDIKEAVAQSLQVKEIVYSCWGACTEPDPLTPATAFKADAIVANPPSFGHVHCAEKLGVPLHMVFTMPWTPTKFFPQPFARIKINMAQDDGAVRQVLNWHSYFAVEKLSWLGIGSYVKDFRQRVLNLSGWDKKHMAHCLYYTKTPFTYIWSPALADRPKDWPAYCEVVGFVNVEVEKLTKYVPPKEITDFLAAGPPPVYIGFGSLVMDNPDKLTKSFLEAVKVTGLRAIIQKGWGGLGQGIAEVPRDVLLIDTAAHDWLFEKCCAVVHHGGAGTTATGLYAGKPTFIVPFFGDQPFWGAACFKAGVGPAPVPIDELDTKKIINALMTLTMPACLKATEALQAAMLKEDGVQGAVDHIYKTLHHILY